MNDLSANESGGIKEPLACALRSKTEWSIRSSAIGFGLVHGGNPFTEITNVVITAVSGGVRVGETGFRRQFMQRRSRRQGCLPNQYHLAIYLAHVVFGLSQRKAGRRFCRDRTTIRYACARIEDARDDPLLDIALDTLSAALAAQVFSIVQTFQTMEFSNEYQCKVKICSSGSKAATLCQPVNGRSVQTA